MEDASSILLEAVSARVPAAASMMVVAAVTAEVPTVTAAVAVADVLTVAVVEMKVW